MKYFLPNTKKKEIKKKHLKDMYADQKDEDAYLLEGLDFTKEVEEVCKIQIKRKK